MGKHIPVFDLLPSVTTSKQIPINALRIPTRRNEFTFCQTQSYMIFRDIPEKYGHGHTVKPTDTICYYFILDSDINVSKFHTQSIYCCLLDHQNSIGNTLVYTILH